MTMIIVMIVNSIVVIINIEFGILPEFMLLPQMFSKGEKDPKRTHPNRLFIFNHWHQHWPLPVTKFQR